MRVNREQTGAGPGSQGGCRHRPPTGADRPRSGDATSAGRGMSAWRPVQPAGEGRSRPGVVVRSHLDPIQRVDHGLKAVASGGRWWPAEGDAQSAAPSCLNRHPHWIAGEPFGTGRDSNRIGHRKRGGVRRPAPDVVRPGAAELPRLVAIAVSRETGRVSSERVRPSGTAVGRGFSGSPGRRQPRIRARLALREVDRRTARRVAPG